MKLLIVDDEELTRTGVISSIDWQSLGISEVLQADDGLNGFETARMYKPEIILCDVRMPRMDGITMLERLEKILPDCVPIFMSGYSDKEYLKAAIKLKAVNYIEKPINSQEIREAILEAKELYIQKVRSHQGESMETMKNASRLAMMLTSPYTSNKEQIDRLLTELSLPGSASACCTSVVVHLRYAPELVEPSTEELYHSFKELLGHYHADCIYVAKRRQYLVYFIFSPSAPSETVQSTVTDFMEKEYQRYGDHFIAVGETFTGIQRAYQSYTSAVVLLESSFFFPVNSILTPKIIEELPSRNIEDSAFSPEESFVGYLSGQNEKDCLEFLDNLRKFSDRNKNILPDQIKDLYYKFFINLENARKQQQLPSAKSEQIHIVAFLENYFTYAELHDTLVQETKEFFRELKNAIPENPTIFLIKDYISKNYMNETLSVKDISAHVFLSASYVCTFFKNETGRTLNQYLTEYRMEKAKSLLADPRYKITDISSKVGYSDGNYFGKSFKKYTGFSPSEYREKMSL